VIEAWCREYDEVNSGGLTPAAYAQQLAARAASDDMGMTAKAVHV